MTYCLVLSRSGLWVGQASYLVWSGFLCGLASGLVWLLVWLMIWSGFWSGVLSFRLIRHFSDLASGKVWHGFLYCQVGLPVWSVFWADFWYGQASGLAFDLASGITYGLVLWGLNVWAGLGSG